MIKYISYAGDTLKGLLDFMHTYYSSLQYSLLINVTASSTRSSFSPLYAVDFDTSKIWHPGNTGTAGEYLQIEITNGYIEIEGYSIQTSNCGANCANPKNWGFSSSKDGIKWTLREDQADTNDQMNGALKSRYIPVKSKGAFRFFRFFVTGPSYTSTDPVRMDVNQVELFGKYYDSLNKCSVRYKCNSSSRFVVYMILMISR